MRKKFSAYLEKFNLNNEMYFKYMLKARKKVYIYIDNAINDAICKI